jgi:hypothetical protein
MVRERELEDTSNKQLMSNILICNIFTPKFQPQIQFIWQSKVSGGVHIPWKCKERSSLEIYCRRTGTGLNCEHKKMTQNIIKRAHHSHLILYSGNKSCTNNLKHHSHNHFHLLIGRVKLINCLVTRFKILFLKNLKVFVFFLLKFNMIYMFWIVLICWY